MPSESASGGPVVRSDAAAIGCCIAACLGVFAQTRNFEFLNFDDPGYITRNFEVQRGLTADSIRWAFTTLTEGHYHPLTWLSHMLMVSAFGMAPSAHHGANVALHALDASCLYVLLVRLTGQRAHALIATLLFAVHPLRAESVAWVTERKDVLSTAFFLLSALCYVAFARGGGLARWLGALVCYALGLLTKPMVITLPVILLVFDVWPLQRIARSRWADVRRDLTRCVLEKVPFFALALGSAAITWFGQHHAGAMLSEAEHSLSARVANTCVAYVAYIGQWVWPSELSIFHPLRPIPVGLGVACALVLVAIGVAVWRVRERTLALLAGYAFYLVTALPVIGLVQVGGQARADRFTYLPSIGLGIMLVWGVPALLRESRYFSGRVGLTASSVALLALAFIAHGQVAVFQSSESVFSHALEIDPDNFLAHNNLGAALSAQGRFTESEAHFKEAVRLNPTYPPARTNLGNALARRGAYTAAIEHYEAALQRQPGLAEAQYNLGLALARVGQYDQAARRYRKALELAPGDSMAHYSFGALLVGRGDREEGIAHLRRAVHLQPGWSEPRALLERFGAVP